MLDPARLQQSSVPATVAAQKPKAVFKMIDNDRMAGSVPAWVPATSAAENAAASLEAQSAGPGRNETNALSYQSPAAATDGDEEPFGFADLLDIINPLQHLPVIGTIYRNITGDEIRSSSRILGGVMFGGFAGAAGSLANVILEEETGKDATETALGFMLQDKRTAGPPEPEFDILSEVQQHELPGTALSFVDLSHAKPATPAKPTAPQWKFNE